MTVDEIIGRLRRTELDNSKITDVTYIEDGTVSEYEPGKSLTGLPPMYRVRLVQSHGPGSHVRSEVWLPIEENWNGRFVGTGNGGIANVLHLSRLKELILEGYACAHTDLGTSSGIACGYGNDDVRADYSHRATHGMTVCAKALIGACYGRGPLYSYFTGGSTGGMQGYSEAQRYPDDYDSIYSSVPSIINTVYHTSYLWNYVKLHNEHREPLFTHDELVRLSSLSAEFFQTRGDGEPGDTFVTDPYCVADRVDGFMTYLSVHYSGLSEEQRKALKAVYTGPADNKGRQIAPGYPMGAELSMDAFCGENCPGIYLFLWAFGPDFDPWSFDFSDDFDEFVSRMGKYINAVNPDLSAFRAHGGKLLAFSGTADPIVLFPETDIYYEKAAAAAGGAEECMKFFRYFLLPGRSHGYGVGADRISSPGKHGYSAFDALVRWVEEGTAPDSLDAVSSDNPDVPGKKPFERPIYPYGSKQFPFGTHPETYSNRYRDC